MDENSVLKSNQLQFNLTVSTHVTCGSQKILFIRYPIDYFFWAIPSVRDTIYV